MFDAPLLSVIVPCYNSATVMRRAIDSALNGGDRLEVIVVDDGSTDSTGEIAEEYARRHCAVRVVRKQNGGHGSAVNHGLKMARGAWVKVLDSDDWLDVESLHTVMQTLETFESEGVQVDALVSNYVYERAERGDTRPVRYRDVMPVSRLFGWRDLGRFSSAQYILMHSLIYRTELLREVGLHLPEHTFYVDNLYAFLPLPAVRVLYYLDVDLYRYFIGRTDQSVSENVMITRIDHQLRVNRLMQDALPAPSTVDRNLYRYMQHYFRIISVVSSLLLIRSGTHGAIAMKQDLWRGIQSEHPRVHRRMRHSLVGQLVNLPGRAGRGVSVTAYKVARRVIGFN